MFAAMSGGAVVFVGVCVLILLWLLYMATFKPDTLMKLRQQDEELKQKRHERMKQAANGGMKAAGILLRILSKKK